MHLNRGEYLEYLEYWQNIEISKFKNVSISIMSPVINGRTRNTMDFPCKTHLQLVRKTIV